MRRRVPRRCLSSSRGCCASTITVGLAPSSPWCRSCSLATLTRSTTSTRRFNGCCRHWTSRGRGIPGRRERSSGRAGGKLVDDVALRAALTAALTIERPRASQPLTFVDGDVRLGGTDVGVASDGEREVIGLARSLLDPPAWTASSACSRTANGTLDKPSVRAAWDAVTATVGSPVGLGTLRTLVVLVRAPRLHYDVHLASEEERALRVGRRAPCDSAHGCPQPQHGRGTGGAGPFVLNLGAGFCSRRISHWATTCVTTRCGVATSSRARSTYTRSRSNSFATASVTAG